MKFDFDKIVARRGTACVKWDAKPPYEEKIDTSDVIPMWVADMDFEVAPCISKAVQERAMHPVYGYNTVPPEYYTSVVNWFSGRHGWTIDPSWIIYTTGVVPAMSAVIKGLCRPGSKVVILTPAYNCFFSAIKNNDCVLAECPLIYKDRYHYIDFELLEQICSDPDCGLFLFCNPHNPSGRVWTEEELRRIGDICRRNNVIVVSDEIHCEIVMPGYHFIPFASLGEEYQHNCVTMNSSSKAFNTAGLQIANIISDNPLWRRKIVRAINVNEICDVNPFGHVALRAAYTDEGAEWLRQLNEYIAGNYKFLEDIFSAELPEFPLSIMDATYLPWVDCSALKGMPTEEVEESLLINEKVWINAGTMYGRDGFIRINLAAPRSLIKEGLQRVVKGLKRLEAEMSPCQ